MPKRKLRQALTPMLVFNEQTIFAGERGENEPRASVTPDDMRELAARLEGEAMQLRNRATAIETRKAGEQETGRRARIIRAAALRAARGVPDSEIIAQLCRALDVPPGDAAVVLADERTRSRAAAKAQRDRQILIHAWKGKTNAQLALRFKLSEKHISRIVAARLHYRAAENAADFLKP